MRNPAVYEERMRPGHWLGPALCVPFSALSLMAEWQEGHPVCKTTDAQSRWRRRTRGGSG